MSTTRNRDSSITGQPSNAGRQSTRSPSSGSSLQIYSSLQLSQKEATQKPGIEEKSSVNQNGSGSNQNQKGSRVLKHATSQPTPPLIGSTSLLTTLDLHNTYSPLTSSSSLSPLGSNAASAYSFSNLSPLILQADDEIFAGPEFKAAPESKDVEDPKFSRLLKYDRKSKIPDSELQKWNSALQESKNTIVEYVKENFGHFTSDVRPQSDDAIVRSIEHVIRESKQIAAWVLMQIAKGNGATWAIHYRHSLFPFDYLVGKEMAERGLPGENMAHIQDSNLEDKKPKEFKKGYDRYLTAQKKFLNNSSKAITSFDENGITFLPACYGFPSHITDDKLRNAVENYLSLFELQIKTETDEDEPVSNLSSKNLLIYAGHFDGVDVARDRTHEFGSHRFKDWLARNEEFLIAKNVKIMTFEALEKSYYYKLASRLIDNMIINKTDSAKKVLLSSVQSYLIKIGDKPESGITLVKSPKFLEEEASKSSSAKNKKGSKKSPSAISKPLDVVGKHMQIPSPSPSTSNSSLSGDSSAEDNSPNDSPKTPPPMSEMAVFRHGSPIKPKPDSPPLAGFDDTGAKVATLFYLGTGYLVANEANVPKEVTERRASMYVGMVKKFVSDLSPPSPPSPPAPSVHGNHNLFLAIQVNAQGDRDDMMNSNEHNPIIATPAFRG